MKKVILFIATSLDGFIAGENGNINWLFHDVDYNYTSFLKTIDTVIMGRKTYEVAKGFEPLPYVGKKKIVFTNQKRIAEQETEFVQDPIKVVEKLKKEQGTNIWLVGGTEIITLLMNKNLIDECIISIHPILLGKGIPLFKDVKANLKFIKEETFESGLIQLSYEKKSTSYSVEQLQE